jgi:hypothetical protein
MRKLKGLTFAAMIALSLVMSTTTALGMDAKHGRETAWTDLGELPNPFGPVEDFSEGVTWE